MSSSPAAVLFPDGTIKYCVYHGTSDLLLPRLFDTTDEAWEANRDGSPAFPDIGEGGEPVRIYSGYGYGFEWAGTATRKGVTSECNFLEVDGEVIDYERGEKPDWLVWDWRRPTRLEKSRVLRVARISRRTARRAERRTA